MQPKTHKCQTVAAYAKTLAARLRARQRRGAGGKVMVVIAIVSDRPRAVRLPLTRAGRRFVDENFDRVVGVYDYNVKAGDMAEAITYCLDHLARNP